MFCQINIQLSLIQLWRPTVATKLLVLYCSHGSHVLLQVAEQAVPQAEKASKVINEQADKIADNIEPMADKASKQLTDAGKQVSEEGPQSADRVQAKVDEIASQVAKQAKPQADKAAQIITGTAQGIKENAEPTAKVCLRRPVVPVGTFWEADKSLCSTPLLVVVNHMPAEF